MTELSETIGIAYAMILSDCTVLASPIQRKPIGSAQRCRMSIAAVPNSRLYAKQRRMAAVMPQPRSWPISSETSLVAAKRIPDMAKVVHRKDTDTTS